jgi:hypothetical protein
MEECGKGKKKDRGKQRVERVELVSNTFYFDIEIFRTKDA